MKKISIILMLAFSICQAQTKKRVEELKIGEKLNLNKPNEHLLWYVDAGFTSEKYVEILGDITALHLSNTLVGEGLFLFFLQNNDRKKSTRKKISESCMVHSWTILKEKGKAFSGYLDERNTIKQFYDLSESSKAMIIGKANSKHFNMSGINKLSIVSYGKEVVFAKYNGVEYTEPKKIQILLNHYELYDYGFYAEKELKLPK